MKKNIIAIFFLVVIGIVIFLLNKKNDKQAHAVAGTLIVGTCADFPPFTFRDQNDEIVGFDIDVVKEVAKRLKLNIDIVDQQFGVLLTNAQIGQIHVIAAGLTPTKERSGKIWFTKPYLTGNPLFILTNKNKSNQIKNLEDLKNKNVIVNTGYTADIYISSLSDINIIRLSKVSDALIALDNNRADAFVTAGFTILPYINKNNSKYNIFKIDQTEETTALGVSQTLPKKLFEEIDSIIEQMISDGTIEALKQKWQLI